ncbi:sel1 repeat family protein, partial [bacterium]|nr:sel1 repeat family protein [bacterium]
CIATSSYTQQSDELANRIYLNALQYANGAGKPYNPDKAVKILKSLAEEGNTKAMNALGIIYATGRGDGIDYRSAMTWFRKAADAGYIRSYYNLSLMWKYGFGVEMNYTESYLMLKKGADEGEPNCLYGLGYMHYKGLGCSQDYGVAMDYFLQAAEKQNSAAIYMTGLCLRNGYGVRRDTAEARKWLLKSAGAGNARADIELRTKVPENSFNMPRMVSGKRYNVEIPEKYRTVNHNVSGSLLSGQFKGYAVKFDWSGGYITEISPLSLTLSGEGDLLTGNWTEADTIAAEVSVMVTDTTLDFIDSYISKPDHYHPDTLPAAFRRAKVKVNTEGSAVYLTGTVQFFSDLSMEPLQPVLISLKSGTEDGTAGEQSPDEPPGAKVLAFPSPFSEKLFLSIDLEDEADVRAELY